MNNADRPNLWKPDIQASVEQYDNCFLAAAPKAYRDTSEQAMKDVESAFTQIE